MMSFNQLDADVAEKIDRIKHFSQEIGIFIDQLEQDSDVDQEKLKSATNHLEKGLTVLVKSVTNKNLIFLA